MGIGALIKREQRVMTPSSPAQLGWAQYLHLFSDFAFNGVSYMVPSGSISQLTALQSIRNPIILRCIILRSAIFSEVTFAFQNKRFASQPGKLFGNQSLALLEEPWPTGSTKDLLGRMEVDNCMYGNSYWYQSAPNMLTWLDPTRMRILTAPVPGPSGVNAGVKLVAYELVDARQHAVETFLPDEIVHYKGAPDPDNPFRGLSWLSALLQDVTTDQDISNFKSGFLRNSATPNLVISLPEEMSQDAIANFKRPRRGFARRSPAVIQDHVRHRGRQGDLGRLVLGGHGALRHPELWRHPALRRRRCPRLAGRHRRGLEGLDAQRRQLHLGPPRLRRRHAPRPVELGLRRAQDGRAAAQLLEPSLVRRIQRPVPAG